MKRLLVDGCIVATVTVATIAVLTYVPLLAVAAGLWVVVGTVAARNRTRKALTETQPR